MARHSLSWTETRLANEGWIFNGAKKCECGEDIVFYMKQRVGGKPVYMVLEEGTLEVHSCPRRQ